jgi:succinate dehydrogenase (ubiquinone) iron-sulfur subunit
MIHGQQNIKNILYISVFMLCFNYIQQGLNPGKAIAEIKKLLSGIAKKDAPGLNTTALLN